MHQHLVRRKTRTQVGLVIDAADVREVHHFALLLGYGAGAICPSLTFEAIEDRIAWDQSPVDPAVAAHNYLRAASKGVVKVMSKMGISTVASYTGAQIFEALGLGHELVDEYFTGTTSKLGGIGLDEIAEEILHRHRRAFPDRPESLAHRELELGGEYQWRREGEYHLFNPRDGLQAPARHPDQAVRGLQGVHESRRRSIRAAGNAPWAVQTRAGRRPRCRSTRSSRSARS